MAVRYFSEFKQYNNRPDVMSVSDIRIEISDNSYVGEPQELILAGSPLRISFTNTGDNKIESIRGSQATMQFVSSNTFQLEDLYTDQEMKFVVDVYKDSNVIWRGFVVPDGCSERFIEPPYVVTVKAIDGLGVLKNIPFGTLSGGVIRGVLSIKDIFQRCLSRLNLNMDVNSFLKLHHKDMLPIENAFDKTKISTDRFITNFDPIERMSSADVLESLLSEFGCSIVQHRGEWVIYRIKDVAKYNGVLNGVFKYDNNGIFKSIVNIDLNNSLGFMNGNIIHAENDQLRRVDKPFKQIKIKYIYGSLPNTIPADTSNFTGVLTGDFTGWDKHGGVVATPNIFEGFATIKPSDTIDKYISIKNSIHFSGGENVKMELDFSLIFGKSAPIAIWIDTTGGRLYLGEEGFTSSFKTAFIKGGEVKKVLVIDFSIPSGGGNVGFNIYYIQAATPPSDGSWDLKLYEIRLTTTGTGSNVISETHTVTNIDNYTTIPPTFEVHCGESQYEGYIGTLLKDNGIDATDGWIENDSTTGFVNFLEIASRAIMTLHNRPMRIYEGTMYGYFDYLSIFTIENLSGIFMPVSLDYDIRKNTTSATLIEIDSADLPVTYNVNYEYEKSKEMGGSGG